MFRFISFGSGSSGNCYYIETDEGALFIDIGIGGRALKKYCQEMGIDLSRVRAVLVTHEHADHVRSVGSVARSLNIPVYATPMVHERIDSNYVVHTKVEPSLKKHIAIGEAFSLVGIRISTIPVPHDSCENVGYRLEYGGKVFILLTDIGHITKEIEQWIGAAHYLVIEANHEEEMLRNGNYPDFLKKRILSDEGHLSNVECGRALLANCSERLKHVWLCHLSNENNDPELARYTVEGILRSGGVIAGKDFELDVLKRNSCTGVIDLL